MENEEVMNIKLNFIKKLIYKIGDKVLFITKSVISDTLKLPFDSIFADNTNLINFVDNTLAYLKSDVPTGIKIKEKDEGTVDLPKVAQYEDIFVNIISKPPAYKSADATEAEADAAESDATSADAAKAAKASADDAESDATSADAAEAVKAAAASLC